jgi:hypothetical protein
MNQPLEKTFQDFTRPKILVSESAIFVCDSVLLWRVFLFLLGVCFVFFAIFFKEGTDRFMGFWFGVAWSVIFLYDSLSLKRTKIDLGQRMIYRKSLNPIENLIDRVLQHPKVISFENVEKIYADYSEAAASAVQRYYVYLRTDDPYNLKIGTFRTQADSELFAEFLNAKLHQQKEKRPKSN